MCLGLQLQLPGAEGHDGENFCSELSSASYGELLNIG